ncbi:polysaccharide deacetylase family protein [Roseomonas sp. HJA6]|uniref:Chitooligosaccharide deacetylase n=1 Tax=Roseomonas alba TaxID=2846776 RepID=A0ABS7AIA1_9PROT|nr:polysaccharide deacetylase family protein [Neoroseomonas alba]MBW6401903.1 polysaccharide deacetylase family protein [Neoroseomonas alba]
MPTRSGTFTYQCESGRTRASARAARRFAALPAIFTFTVDVETHPGGSGPTGPTARLLDLLEARGSRGTFFILDSVTRSEPGLVREIARRGHEIASHGHAHRHLAEEAPAAFRMAMATARDRLAALTGFAPVGFRAPYFSLTPAAGWVPEVLAELGFAYSSSLLPARNPLAGWPGAPRGPFRWPSGLLELPVPVGRIGPVAVPFLGGMYLRWLPPWRLSGLARNWAAGGQGGLWSYCHPYDLDTDESLVHRPDAGPFGSLMLWLNRRTTLPRLEGLLEGRRSLPFAARLVEFSMVPTWGGGGEAPAKAA